MSIPLSPRNYVTSARHTPRTSSPGDNASSYFLGASSLKQYNFRRVALSAVGALASGQTQTKTNVRYGRSRVSSARERDQDAHGRATAGGVRLAS